MWRTVLWCGWLLVAGAVEGAFTNTNALIIRPKIQDGRPGGPTGAWAVSLPPQVGAELTITVIKAEDGYVLKARNTPGQANPYYDQNITPMAGQGFIWMGGLTNSGTAYSGSFAVANAGVGSLSSTVRVACTWVPAGGSGGVGGGGNGEINGEALGTATRTGEPVSWQFDRTAQVADA